MIAGTYLVAKSVSPDDDRLDPSRNRFRDLGEDDGFTENGAS